MIFITLNTDDYMKDPNTGYPAPIFTDKGKDGKGYETERYEEHLHLLIATRLTELGCTWKEYSEWA